MTKMNKQVRVIINIILAVWVLGLLALVLSSCNPQKRMAKLMDRHPITAAKECDVRWPFVPSSTDTLLVVDTALIERYEYEFAYLSHVLDSLLSRGCDSATAIRIVELVKQKPCPPQPTKIITKEIENTRRQQIIRDSATAEISKAFALQKQWESKATALDKKAKLLQHFNDRLKKQCNNYLLLLVVAIVLLFRKHVFSLLKKIM